MSLSILNIKPEDVDNGNKRAKYSVCIVGCGQTGIIHACLFAEAGFNVICTDRDQALINNVSKGKGQFLSHHFEVTLRNCIRKGTIKVVNDVGVAVSGSQIIIITTSVKISEKRKIDYSELEKTCKQIGSNLKQGSLVIVASPLGVGFTEKVVKEIMESISGFKIGVNIGLAYSPLLIVHEEIERALNQKRVVAASEKASLNAASVILGTVMKGNLIKTENIKAAETAILFDIARSEINNALINEFAFFCEKTSVDYIETQKFTKHSSLSEILTSRFLDENSHKFLYTLSEDAENVNLKLRLIEFIKDANEETVKHIVNLVKDALRSCDKPLRRARISILGISQIPNVKTPPKMLAKEVANMLEARGAKISIYDPFLSCTELANMQFQCNKTLTQATEGMDCLLILTGHDNFKRLNLKKTGAMMKKIPSIVDIEGAVDPYTVEREGFIYRGFGRGVWTK